MKPRKSKYTKELLETAVSNSFSIAAVLRSLGLKETGGNYQHIKNKVKNYGIDTSHFTGQEWNRGLTKETSASIAAQAEKAGYSDEEILRTNSPQTLSKQLKRLMLKYGREYKCENGHDAEWMGEPLTLHIDHINGERTDNRLCNLRFLCPNCHQQTHTWGKRKIIIENPKK